MLIVGGCQRYWMVRCPRLICLWATAGVVALMIVRISSPEVLQFHGTLSMRVSSARSQYVAEEEVRRPNGAYLVASMLLYQLYGPLSLVDGRWYARCATRQAGSLLIALRPLLTLCANDLSWSLSCSSRRAAWAPAELTPGVHPGFRALATQHGGSGCSQPF